MLVVSQGSRRVAAMILNEPDGNVRGIVQCVVPGCEAHVVIGAIDGDPAAFVADFMRTHDCDPNRFLSRAAPSRRRVLLPLHVVHVDLTPKKEN